MNVADDRERWSAEETSAQVIFIMGTARSGSTLLGAFLGQDPDVFFAGELCDWPRLNGSSPIPRSGAFWDEVRLCFSDLPSTSSRFKMVMEHPVGLFRVSGRRRIRADYETLSAAVVGAVSRVSSCRMVVDSSHYPRRAMALRRILGEDRVRLLFAVRRPSRIARSFRQLGDKSEIEIQAYLFVVGILSWWAYLTHDPGNRIIVSHKDFVRRPHQVGEKALGRRVEGADPDRIEPPQALVANRFVRSAEPVAVTPSTDPHTRWIDRITDIVQVPLSVACWWGERT